MERIHIYLYVLLTRPTALSDFVLYYTFYVYIFSCLFLDPPMFALYLYVLRIRTTYAFYLYSICTFLPICFTYPPYTYTLYLYILLIRYTYTSNLHVILTCSTYNIMYISTLLSLHFFRPISQNFFSQNFSKNFSKIIHSIFLKIFCSHKIFPKYSHSTYLLCADSKIFSKKKE